jgi:hypothetical protein
MLSAPWIYTVGDIFPYWEAADYPVQIFPELQLYSKGKK